MLHSHDYICSIVICQQERIWKEMYVTCFRVGLLYWHSSQVLSKPQNLSEDSTLPERNSSEKLRKYKPVRFDSYRLLRKGRGLGFLYEVRTPSACLYVCKLVSTPKPLHA
jgi:hypothetical protein